jgi:hypothetical protein
MLLNVSVHKAFRVNTRSQVCLYLINKEFKLTKYLLLVGLAFNFFVYSSTSASYPFFQERTCRIELILIGEASLTVSSYRYKGEVKSKSSSPGSSKIFFRGSLILQNRLCKTKLNVLENISLKIIKPISPIISFSREFEEELPVQYIG